MQRYDEQSEAQGRLRNLVRYMAQELRPIVSACEHVFDQWEDVRWERAWVGKWRESLLLVPRQGIEVYTNTLTRRPCAAPASSLPMNSPAPSRSRPQALGGTLKIARFRENSASLPQSRAVIARVNDQHEQTKNEQRTQMPARI